VTSKATFHPNGITLSLPDGDVVLNAGNNMTILPQGDLITFSAQVPPGTVINNKGTWQPPSMADANAPNNSIYFSTTNGKLSYRDPSGGIFPLY